MYGIAVHLVAAIVLLPAQLKRNLSMPMATD
jgi:hypothetical protein